MRGKAGIIISERNPGMRTESDQSTPTDAMTTESSHSQTGEDDEDDYYGTTTHSCHYCSRTFSAAWTEDHIGLVVVLGLSRQESKQAARDGCVFHSHYAFLFNEEKTSKILIERNA
jgi:hypothetical protein